MSKNQGSVSVFIVVALAFVLGAFWFLGKEAYKAENLAFSIIPEKERGQKAVTVQISAVGGQPNATSEFTKVFIEDYINPFINSSTTENGVISQKVVLEKFYGSLEKVAPKNIPYVSVEELNIVPSGKDATKDYINTIKQIEKDLVFKNLGLESYFYTNYALTGSSQEKEDAAKELKKSAEVYKEMANRLSRMRVPEDVAEDHKIMANAILDLSLGSHYLGVGMSDPLTALLGVHFYQQGLLARE